MFDELFSELDRNPSLSAYAKTARKLQSASLELAPFRAAIVSNHTIDIAVPLAVECARRGLKLELLTGGYDQYRQELLEAGGAVDRFSPDAILISLHLETAFPDLSAATCAASQQLPNAALWISQFQALLQSYRTRSSLPIFVQNFIPLAVDMDGLLSSSGTRSLFDW